MDRAVGHDLAQVYGGRRRGRFHQSAHGRCSGLGIARPPHNRCGHPLVAQVSEAAQQVCGHLGVPLGPQCRGQRVPRLWPCHVEQSPGHRCPYLGGRIAQSRDQRVQEVLGAAVRQQLQGPHAGGARALAGGADHLRPHSLVVPEPPHQTPGPPPHGAVRVTEQPDQGRDIPGHAQCVQAVQGIDPQVVVRVGQQSREGLCDRGSFESQPYGGDRGPASYARVRVRHQREQHLATRLGVPEPAEGQGGGRAYRGRGVAGRLGEDADVRGSARPAQPLHRRRAPLRVRRRRLAQGESDLMVRPHGHLREGRPPRREKVAR